MDLGKPKSRGGVGRRRFLAAAGSGSTALLGGCLGFRGSGSAGNGLDTLDVAFKPVFPFLQFPVMRREGYLSELDASVDATNFANEGLTIVSAYAKGNLDVAFMGITPVIKMKARGLPGKVVAANHKNGFAVMASDEFAGLYERHGGDAFAKFRERKGRKFKFATFPKASVAFHLVHLWLDELGVDPGRIAIEPMAGGGPIKRALLSGNVDGTFVMEPIRTAVVARGAPFRQIAWSGEFMSAQPGGVMLMHDRVWDDHPGTAKALLRGHGRATDLINGDPAAAAGAVSEALDGKVPKKLAKRALRSKISNYVTDPRVITGDTRPFVEQMHSLGQIPSPVPNDEIFETSLYADVA